MVYTSRSGLGTDWSADKHSRHWLACKFFSLYRAPRPSPPPNKTLLQSPHTLVVGCDVLRQRSLYGVRRSRICMPLGGG